MSNITSKESRDAMLDELENIREMLNEDAALSAEELAFHEHELDIPVLLPDDNLDDGIPLLAEAVDAEDDIPTLSVVQDEDDGVPVLAEAVWLTEEVEIENQTETETAPVPRKNPLDVIRAAAAKVAANAVRYRETSPEMLADMVPYEGIAPSSHAEPPVETIEKEIRPQPADVPVARAADILPEKSRLAADISALQTEIEAVIRQGEPVEKSAVGEQKPAQSPVRSSADIVRDALAENIVRGLVKEALVEDIVRVLMPLLEEQVRKILDEKLQMQADESMDLF
ncbi:MAG TPA: hypothetical protein PLF22_04470 [Pseudomonadales bacterium]|nr:hypothetical protein [Pseudomonadales bacterium]